MSSFFKLLSKNIKEARGAGYFQANGLDVSCVHCDYDKFLHSQAQLNTAFLSFLNLDFANRSADTLTCDRCGYIHWFNKGVQRVYK